MKPIDENMPQNAQILSDNARYNDGEGFLSSIFQPLKGLFAANDVVRRREPVSGINEKARSMSFTFALIALSAKLISAGGNVSKKNYADFRKAFPFKGSDEGKIRHLFMLAINEESEVEQYIRQIKSLFPRNKEIYLEILGKLRELTFANSTVNSSQYEYLHRVFNLFGLNSKEWSRFIEGNFSANDNPYKMLGISKNATKEDVKRAYRRRMSECHPDRHAAQGASEQVVEMMTNRTININAAYSVLKNKKATKRNA